MTRDPLARRPWLTPLGWAATTTPPVERCAFPTCIRPASTANRAGQRTCAGHRAVVVAAWAPQDDDTEAVQP